MTSEKIVFIVDGKDEKTVYRSVRDKCEGMCDLMNRLNHKAKGIFGAGRYYVTDVCDAEAA